MEVHEEGGFHDKERHGEIRAEEVLGEETLGGECPEVKHHGEAVPGVVVLGWVYPGEEVPDAASVLGKAGLGAEVLGEDPDGDRVRGVLELLCEVRVGVEGHAWVVHGEEDHGQGPERGEAVRWGHS